MPSKVNLAETSVSILRTWFNFLPGMAYRCNNDHDWTMQIVSAGSLELTGYTPLEFLERKVSYDSVILPEFQDKVWNVIQEAVVDRTPFTVEYKIRTKTGDVRWVWEKGTGIYDDDGSLLFLEGYIADISDRKAREEELDTFFDIQPELMCISTLDGKFLKINRMWEKIFGYTSDELIGESFQKLIHPDDLPKTTQKEYISGDGIVQGFRNRYLTKSGTVIYLEWSAAIKDGKYYASARDITERVMLEKALSSNESLMRSMINAITESAFLMEPDGNVILCNTVTAERFGNKPEDLIGKNIFDKLPPAVAESRREKVETVLNSGQPLVFEDVRSGRVILNSIYPVFDDEGKVARVAVFGYDITDRKETITRLEKATDELKELNDLKNKFISILAHDLRGPFHPLLSSLELLDIDYDSMTEKERKSFIRSGRETAVQLFELLESILSWSRVSRGKITLNLQKLDVNEAVLKAATQLSIVSDSKKISVNLPGGDVVTALADTEMLITALRNILSNSIKFSNPGSTVEISTGSDDEYTRIIIRDYGLGIEQAKLDDIFEITRTRSTRGTHNEPGSGMGLLICKEMVTKMNGKISFQSRPGSGTTVTISLPKA